MIIGVHREVEEHGEVAEEAEDAARHDHMVAASLGEHEGERAEHQASDNLAHCHEDSAERGESLPVEAEPRNYMQSVFYNQKENIIPLRKANGARVDTNDKRLIDSSEEHGNGQKKHVSR